MDTAPVMLPKRTCFSAISMVMLAVAGLLVADPGSSGAAPLAWRTTMVAFSNVSDRDLDVYESEDGTGFQPLRLSAYRPPSGVVRDPSIFRHTDGFYYLTYTTIDGANIGFARSSDRMDWKFLGAWPVPFCCAFLPGTGDGTGSASPPGSSGSAGFSDGPSLSPFTTKAWAPEWFVDGDRVNVILSLSTGGGFVPYLMTALEPSLRLWSPPVPLAGIGADHIDTTVVKVGSTYHAFTKNETKKVVEHAVASSVTGPIHSSRLEIGARWWRAQPWFSCRTTPGGYISTPIPKESISIPTAPTGCAPGHPCKSSQAFPGRCATSA